MTGSSPFLRPNPAYSTPARQAWDFWCPGCQQHHTITSRWQIRNWQPLTVSPSLRVSTRRPAPASAPKARMVEITLCHLFIEKDHLRFLPDCLHALAGQTVPMQPPKPKETPMPNVNEPATDASVQEPKPPTAADSVEMKPASAAAQPGAAPKPTAPAQQPDRNPLAGGLVHGFVHDIEATGERVLMVGDRVVMRIHKDFLDLCNHLHLPPIMRGKWGINNTQAAQK